MLKLKTLTIYASPSYLLALDQGKGVRVNRSDLSVLTQSLKDCEFSAFCNLKYLEILDLGPFMAITPAGAVCLSKISSLKTLRLRQNQLLADEGFENICNMTNLNNLHFACCQFVSSFLSLTRLLKLKSLSLFNSFILNADLEVLTQLPQLEFLDISECPKITDAGLRNFMELCANNQISYIKTTQCRRLREFVAYAFQKDKREVDNTGKITVVWKEVKDVDNLIDK